MGTNKHDIQVGQRKNPVARFSFWTGLLSIPSAIILLGIPLGLIAYITGGKVISWGKNNQADGVEMGRATLGRYFGCAGIILSIVWGVILIIMLVFGAIANLFK